MAATVKELRDWLAQFEETELVGVDDGGLTLCVIDDDSKGLSVQPQFEIGGLPSIQAIYELDEHGEATGVIHWCCSDHAWTLRRTEYVGPRFSDPSENSDALPGTQCEACELLANEEKGNQG